MTVKDRRRGEQHRCPVCGWVSHEPNTVRNAANYEQSIAVHEERFCPAARDNTDNRRSNG